MSLETWHTTVCQVYPFSIPAREVSSRNFLWTQNCPKSHQILRLLKQSRLKYEFHAKNPEYSFIIELHWFKTANSSKIEIRLYNFLRKTIAGQVSFTGNLSVFPLHFPFPPNLINKILHLPKTFSKNLYLNDSQKPRGVWGKQQSCSCHSIDTCSDKPPIRN